MSTTTRVARCQCGAERPPDPSLPFFEDRGPGTQERRCVHCRYLDVAHDLKAEGRVLPYCCDDFTPMAEGYETDVFYCGCAGLD